ncbi:MAG TPA: SRPBCC family protein [bacterium]|nr:SRPBCC family protein [bacterium]
MHTETTAHIAGSPEEIYGYAARVEEWPRWLPHYRDVRVIASRGNERIVEMRGRRGRIPVWWWARQTLLPGERRIRYTHLRGITRGMEVEWRIIPDPRGAVVTIVHDLALGWPLIGRPVAKWIIGPMFVEPIAGATLRRIKMLVEHSTAPAGGGR